MLHFSSDILLILLLEKYLYISCWIYFCEDYVNFHTFAFELKKEK